MAKQLDCKTSITSTENKGIQGIHFDPHITIRRLSSFACKRKAGYDKISDVSCTTSKSNRSNLRMVYDTSTLIPISCSAMIVGLKLTCISSEHYTTDIVTSVSSSVCHISQFR